MDAVGKEQALGIYRELVKLLTCAVTLIVVQDVLHHMTDRNVVLAVLVPMDVTSPFGCLGQMVCILFLLQSELLPSGDGVTHHLKVRKLIKQILEVTFLLSATGCNGQRTSNQHDSCQSFHIILFQKFYNLLVARFGIRLLVGITHRNEELELHSVGDGQF